MSSQFYVSNCSQVGRQDVVKVLDQSKYFSFTNDDATDFIGDDIENIFIRTCTLGKTPSKTPSYILDLQNLHAVKIFSTTLRKLSDGKPRDL
jgi:hypothetical protein